VSNPTLSSTSIPIYADRNSGENFADAKKMVNAYLARFASRATLPDDESGLVDPTPRLDSTGYAQVQRGGATIGINVLEEQGVLMVFTPIMPVPLAGREALYRRLLELSFVTTSDASFAVNTHQEEIVVRSLRRLSALDYEEFEDIVATVGEVADRYDDALIREFGS
jgi:hypothetical protein